MKLTKEYKNEKIKELKRLKNILNGGLKNVK